MAPYLPREGHAGSPYSEGGALYALGLITANHGSGIQPFLTESLRASGNPIIQHGACLGLGECFIWFFLGGCRKRGPQDCSVTLLGVCYVPFLTESLRASGNPIIQNGACLELGECVFPG
jgi:hypothetical protein